MSNKVTNASVIMVVINALFVIGNGIYYCMISIFDFGVVSEQITTVVNYIFDLLFNSLNLLSFFIRPSTLSYVCRMFCFYYLLQFEFKFYRMCVKLAIRIFETVKDLIGKSTSVVTKLFGV